VDNAQPRLPLNPDRYAPFYSIGLVASSKRLLCMWRASLPPDPPSLVVADRLGSATEIQRRKAAKRE
jgi:hypothetical protein